jgi:sugar diacid utilization regulator
MGIPHILQSQLRSFFPKCMSLRYRGDIVLLISSEAEQLSLPEKTEADFLRFLKSNSLCCGISNVFTSVVQMPDFYYQTEIAIIYGSRLSKNHLIYQYNEYAIFHVFSSCTESISLRELCHPGVLHLWESHKESDKELLRTLYLYLFHMKNVNKVCTELHIHRNTLFYRLNRVKSIIKDEIDNSASLFRILLSFELIKYYAMDTQAGDPFLFPFL